MELSSGGGEGAPRPVEPSVAGATQPTGASDAEPKDQRKWVGEEDRVIREHVAQFGATEWFQITLEGRSAVQCSNRWRDVLDPEISREPWSAQEDQALPEAHATHGNHWQGARELSSALADWKRSNTLSEIQATTARVIHARADIEQQQAAAGPASAARAEAEADLEEEVAGSLAEAADLYAASAQDDKRPADQAQSTELKTQANPMSKNAIDSLRECFAAEDETLVAIASRLRIEPTTLLEINQPRYPGLAEHSKLMAGTSIVYPFKSQAQLNDTAPHRPCKRGLLGLRHLDSDVSHLDEEVWCNFDARWYRGKIIEQVKGSWLVQFYSDDTLERFSDKEASKDLWLVHHGDGLELDEYLTQHDDESVDEISALLGSDTAIMLGVNQRRYKTLKRTSRLKTGTSLLYSVKRTGVQSRQAAANANSAPGGSTEEVGEPSGCVECAPRPPTQSTDGPNAPTCPSKLKPTWGGRVAVAQAAVLGWLHTQKAHALSSALADWKRSNTLSEIQATTARVIHARAEIEQGAQSAKSALEALETQPKQRAWMGEEDRAIREHVAQFGATKWFEIVLEGRSAVQCSNRWHGVLAEATTSQQPAASISGQRDKSSQPAVEGHYGNCLARQEHLKRKAGTMGQDQVQSNPNMQDEATAESTTLQGSAGGAIPLMAEVVVPIQPGHQWRAEDRVQLIGLKRGTMNGSNGTIRLYEQNSGRWQVELDQVFASQCIYAVKPQNLVPLVTAAASDDEPPPCEPITISEDPVSSSEDDDQDPEDTDEDSAEYPVEGVEVQLAWNPATGGRGPWLARQKRRWRQKVAQSTPAVATCAVAATSAPKPSKPTKAASDFWLWLWPSLERLGWRIQYGHRPGDRYYCPPGVNRMDRGMKSRRDYFDSYMQVADHCRSSPDSQLQALIRRAETASAGHFPSKQREVPYEEDADVKIAVGAKEKGWKVTVIGYRCGHPQREIRDPEGNLFHSLQEAQYTFLGKPIGVTPKMGGGKYWAQTGDRHCKGVSRYDPSAFDSRKPAVKSAGRPAALPDPRAPIHEAPEDTSVCAFCGEPEDTTCKLFARPAFRENGRDGNLWVHDDCMIHSPEVYEGELVDDLYVEAYNVIRSVKRSRMLACAVCGQKGASIGCFVGSCKISVHYHCALKTTWDFGDSREFYCEKHRGNRAVEWLQCDTCQKWRILPRSVKAASVGDTWQCSDAYWDKTLTCETPETLDAFASLGAQPPAQDVHTAEQSGFLSRGHGKQPKKRAVDADDDSKMWVQCDICHKWRQVRGPIPDRWTCAENDDAAFQSCAIPQIMSDEEIDRQLGLQTKKRKVKHKQPVSTMPSQQSFAESFACHRPVFLDSEVHEATDSMKCVVCQYVLTSTDRLIEYPCKCHVALHEACFNALLDSDSKWKKKCPSCQQTVRLPLELRIQNNYHPSGAQSPLASVAASAALSADPEGTTNTKRKRISNSPELADPVLVPYEGEIDLSLWRSSTLPSGYRGVYRDKSVKKRPWKAQIATPKVRKGYVWLGMHATKEQAAEAVARKWMELFGEPPEAEPEPEPEPETSGEFGAPPGLQDIPDVEMLVDGGVPYHWIKKEPIDFYSRANECLPVEGLFPFQVKPVGSTGTVWQTNHDWIGRTVARNIKGEYLNATVTKWLPARDNSQAVWHVVYACGKTGNEDLDEDEMLEGLVAADRGLTSQHEVLAVGAVVHGWKILSAEVRSQPGCLSTQSNRSVFAECGCGKNQSWRRVSDLKAGRGPNGKRCIGKSECAFDRVAGASEQNPSSTLQSNGTRGSGQEKTKTVVPTKGGLPNTHRATKVASQVQQVPVVESVDAVSTMDLAPWRSKRNTTGYLGVKKVGQKYEARLSHKGKTVYLGSYSTKEQAAEAVARKWMELHGKPPEAEAEPGSDVKPPEPKSKKLAQSCNRQGHRPNSQSKATKVASQVQQVPAVESLDAVSAMDLAPWRSKRNPTGYLGVKKAGQKYSAKLWQDGKHIYLGMHSTKEQAAEAVARKYLEVHGKPPGQGGVDGSDIEWQTDGHAWIGRKVARSFNGIYSMANVTKWVPAGDNAQEDPALWHIVYCDDGDEEDLNEDEMVEGLAAARSAAGDRAASRGAPNLTSNHSTSFHVSTILDTDDACHSGRAVRTVVLQLQAHGRLGIHLNRADNSVDQVDNVEARQQGIGQYWGLVSIGNIDTRSMNGQQIANVLSERLPSGEMALPRPVSITFEETVGSWLDELGIEDSKNVIRRFLSAGYDDLAYMLEDRTSATGLTSERLRDLGVADADVPKVLEALDSPAQTTIYI